MAAGGVLGLLVVHADRALGLGAEDRRIGLLHTTSAIGSLAAAAALPHVARRLGQGLVSIVGFGVFVQAATR